MNKQDHYPNSENIHLLVVDDDERLRHLLVKFLKEQGFHISEASQTTDATILLQTFAFDLIILDIMMPGETGLDFTKRLREESYEGPILLLTAMGEVESRIEGLKRGADEYLPKPFEPEELLWRIHAILKRTKAKNNTAMFQEIAIGPFHFHRKKGILRQGDQRIPLTDAEIKLLKALIDHQDTPLSRETLMTLTHISSIPRTVDVHITRLRRKIEVDPKNPLYLQTIRHKGYVLYCE